MWNLLYISIYIQRSHRLFATKYFVFKLSGFTVSDAYFSDVKMRWMYLRRWKEIMFFQTKLPAQL